MISNKNGGTLMASFHHVYIAACADTDNDGGIYHYTLEGDALTFIEKTPVDKPMYMDLTADDMQIILKQPLHSVHESALVTYPLKDHKLQSPSPIQMTLGMEGCHLCRFHGKTFVANYSSGSLFASDGTLVTHDGHGPNQPRQDMPHTHYINVSPDGKYLLSVDLGQDTIYTYDDTLAELSTAKVPDGYGPRHLAYSDDGKTVFCINELDCSVSVFAYDDGKLTYKNSTFMFDAPLTVRNTAAAIRVSGDYVYASNRGMNDITVLKWDNEKLTVVSKISCGGKSPRDILLVDDILFVTNESSDNVTLFKVNGAELTKLDQELHMPGPLAVAAC